MDYKGTVDLLWVFDGYYNAGSTVKPHAHLHHYNLILIQNGAAEFELGSSVFVPTENEFLLILPGVGHGVRAVRNAGMQTTDIKFVTEDAGLKRILNALPHRMPASALARELVLAIHDAANSPFNDALSIHAGNSYLLALLFCLGTTFLRIDKKQDSLSLDKDDESAFSPITQEAMQYLRKNYRENILLNDLAQELKYNKNYICGVFSRDTGKTINSCLTQIRVQKAEELLSLSHYSLAQIAQNTGFQSLSHFIRTFRKYAGLPPGMYRKAHTFDDILNDLGDIPLSKEFIDSLTGKKALLINRTGKDATLQRQKQPFRG